MIHLYEIILFETIILSAIFTSGSFGYAIFAKTKRRRIFGFTCFAFGLVIFVLSFRWFIFN